MVFWITLANYGLLRHMLRGPDWRWWMLGWAAAGLGTITKAVGVLKAKYNLPPADPAREEYQIERLRRLAKDAHLDPDFAEKFLNFIIKEVIRHHEAIAAEHGGVTEKTA